MRYKYTGEDTGIQGEIQDEIELYKVRYRYRGRDAGVQGEIQRYGARYRVRYRFNGKGVAKHRNYVWKYNPSLKKMK